MKLFAGLMVTVLYCGCALSAFAQQAPAVPDPATLVIAPPTCDKPLLKIDRGANTAEQNRFTKRVNVYVKCMNDYAIAQQATANQYAQVAQKYVDSGNTALATAKAAIEEAKQSQEDAQ